MRSLPSMKDDTSMSRHSLTKLILFPVVLYCMWSGTSHGLAAQSDENALCTRSLDSAGETARLQRLLRNARRGETVTVGVIGGSITQGAGASQPDRRYGD